MIFDDYSPPKTPNHDQQRDALRKGLGRAVVWARDGQLDEEMLLTACLSDNRYDREIENLRGDWFATLIQTVGAAGRFREPIFRALRDLPARDAGQLCQLAHSYAQRGDDDFRTRLYEIVERKPIADAPWLGEREIVALEGERAFVFAARVRGRTLTHRNWEWDDRALVEDGVERFGEGRTEQLLADPSDDALAAFRAGWVRERSASPCEGPEGRQERIRALAVDDVLAAAATGGNVAGLLVGWGMRAADADLGAVLRHLAVESEPQTLARLLRVFSRRPLPCFDERLFALCRHGDAAVRRSAFKALAENAHPLVRQFALSEVEKGLRDGAVARLFARNYAPGDETCILDALELPDDEESLHGLLLDIVQVLEENPAADPSQLAVVAYALTPCENCRSFAAELLLEHGVAPEWLRQEIRFDSSEDTRKLAVAPEPTDVGAGTP